MRKILYLSFLISLFLLILIPSLNFAQNDFSGNVSVSVTEINFEKPGYRGGEEIKGYFEVKNFGKNNVSNLGYSINLVGDFRDGSNPSYSLKNGDIVSESSLLPDQSKKIEFSYLLPENIPYHDLGLRIRIFAGNQRIDFNTKRFNYYKTEDTTFMLTEKVEFKVDGENIGPNNNFPVKDYLSADITFRHKNFPTSDIKPIVSISSIDKTKKDLIFIEGKLIHNDSNFKKFSFDADLTTLPDGIYELKSWLLRQNDLDPISDVYTTRFFKGNFIDLSKFSVDKESVSILQNLKFDFEIEPYFINKDLSNSSFFGEIIVLDDSGYEVGKSSFKISSLYTKDQISSNVKINKKFDNLKSKIIIKDQDANILLEKEIDLDITYSNTYFIVVITLVGLVFIVVGVYFIKTRQWKRAGTFVLLLFIVFLSRNVSNYSNVFADGSAITNDLMLASTSTPPQNDYRIVYNIFNTQIIDHFIDPSVILNSSIFNPKIQPLYKIASGAISSDNKVSPGEYISINLIHDAPGCSYNNYIISGYNPPYTSISDNGLIGGEFSTSDGYYISDGHMIQGINKINVTVPNSHSYSDTYGWSTTYSSIIDEFNYIKRFGNISPGVVSTTSTTGSGYGCDLFLDGEKTYGPFMVAPYLDTSNQNPQSIGVTIRADQTEYLNINCIFTNWIIKGCRKNMVTYFGETESSIRLQVIDEGGQCGISDSGSFETTPTANLCSVGSATQVQLINEGGVDLYKWNCEVPNRGTDSCQAYKTCPLGQKSCNGLCIDENESCYEYGFCPYGTFDYFYNIESIPPPLNLTNAGNSEPIIYPGVSIQWEAYGIGGAPSDYCVSTHVNCDTGENTFGYDCPVCGSSINQTFIFGNPPNSNLCTSGTPGSVTLNQSQTKYEWGCYNTDITSYPLKCSASVEFENGQCGIADGSVFNFGSVPSVENLCSVGSSSNFVTNTNSYNWKCNGTNVNASTDDVNCSATRCASGQFACNGQCVNDINECNPDCPTGYKDCNNGCIPNANSCDPDPCPTGEKRCNGECVPEANVCNPDCPIGYRECNGVCILQDANCGDERPPSISNLRSRGLRTNSQIINKGEGCKISWNAEGEMCTIKKKGSDSVTPLTITNQGQLLEFTDNSVLMTSEYTINCSSSLFVGQVANEKISCIVNPDSSEF